MTAAVVLAGAPGAPGVLAGLAPRLDAGARARLQDALIGHAAAWASEVAPGRATVVVHPAGEVSAAVPDGVAVEPGRGADPGELIAAATVAAFERHGGPVLVVAAGVPRLGRHHAEAALGDLAAGVEASFGPGMDGGWYLAALARPRPELFELAAEVWDGPVVMARTLEVATRLGIEVGLLRMERRLVSPEDVAAFLLDPLTPACMVDALSGEAGETMGPHTDVGQNRVCRSLTGEDRV